MMKSLLAVWVPALLLSGFIGFGQENTSSHIRKSYETYFELPRESVHLHLNKTSFLKGEKIWFTAYIRDRSSGLPSLNTSNLYCFLYNADGKVLTKKTFLAKGGIAYGQFEVEKHYSTKAIYIKAFTNWMRNFDTDESFVQCLNILGNHDFSENKELEQKEISVDFLPEGGHLVHDTNNTVGFVIRSNTEDKIEIGEGRILDDEGDVLLRGIQISESGSGKFALRTVAGRRYFAEFELSDGTVIREELPEIELEGVAISVNCFTDDKVSVLLHTNQNTLNKIQDKTFYLAIHRDGKIGIKSIVFNARQIKLQIDKKELLPGINILTLFDPDHNPIAERIFFNEYGIQKQIRKTKLRDTSVENDSVRLSFSLEDNTAELSTISASVIPADTKSNGSARSIISSFFIDPYLKEGVNFHNDLLTASRKRLYETDIFLLTQAWSQYNWSEIFDGAPKPEHKHFEGIKAVGRVINAEFKKPNQLVMLPNSEAGLISTPINREKLFSIEDIYLIKGDSIDVSLLDIKGKPEKPKLEISFSDDFATDEYTVFQRITNLGEFVDESEIDEEISLETLEQDGTFQLDNVTLYADLKEKQLTQNRGLTFGVFEGVKITEQDVRRRIKLSNFIRSLGFKVWIDPMTNNLFVGARIRYFDPPVIVLNGFTLRNENLKDFPLETIDEVYYEHQGTHGSNGGTIYIYRRFGKLVGQKSEENFIRVLATKGFDRPEKYYNPRYSSFTNQGFIDYGVIHWQPDIIAKAGEQFQIKFPNFGVDEILLRLEGMGSDGSLISEEKVIRLDD